jgi:hypothetical protein
VRSSPRVGTDAWHTAIYDLMALSASALGMKSPAAVAERGVNPQLTPVECL